MTNPADLDSPSSPIQAVDASPTPPTPPPGRIRRFGRGLWRVTKWLIVIALLAGVAAAVYFGWPEVDRRFIQPIADNTAGLSTLEDRLTDTRSQVGELQAQVDAAIAAQGGLPDRLADAEASLEELQGAVDELDAQARAVDRMVQTHDDRLAALEEVQSDLVARQQTSENEAIRQLDLIRSTELLGRAQLFLFQANYGLAAQDVRSARSLVTELQAADPERDPALMNEVLFRLDRTLDQLPERPVAAAGDLEIAWSLLVGQTAPPEAPDVLPET